MLFTKNKFLIMKSISSGHLFYGIAIFISLSFSNLLPTTNTYVYKTPSGKKYHLESCNHVNNVSTRLTIEEAVNKFGLTPCKRCKPPILGGLGIASVKGKDKSVGACATTQCNGLTKQNLRCKHKTKLCNGYCFQHNPDKKKTS